MVIKLASSKEVWPPTDPPHQLVPWPLFNSSILAELSPRGLLKINGTGHDHPKMIDNTGCPDNAQGKLVVALIVTNIRMVLTQLLNNCRTSNDHLSNQKW